MKRFLCTVLLLAFLLSAFSLPVLAATEPNDHTDALEKASSVADASDGAEKETAEDNDELVDIASFNCTYDVEAKRVRVSGTIQSSVFADRSNYTIAVYAVPPGETEYGVISDKDSKCLAEAPISIKFEFSFRASEIIDRYSRYAVVLRSPEGEYTLTTEAQYPEVSSDFAASNNKKYYKGLSAEYSSAFTDVSAGSAILPLYWDSLFSDSSSSNLFIGVDGKQFFFNKTTIDKLDVALRSMSVSGTKVYLRLLKRPQGHTELEGELAAEYLMPDVYDEETITKLHAAVTFITERYSKESGAISGIIIGKGWDEPDKYNYFPVSYEEEYVDRCTTYAVIVGNAARTVDPSIEIAIPLMGEGFSEKSEDGNNEFRVFVESFLDYLDNIIHGGVNCSFLMETSESPLGISNDNINEGISVNTPNPDKRFYAGAQKEFSNYLADLNEKYRSCPQKYIFLWTPSENVSGNALAAAYVYSYYTLLADSSVSFFAVDLTDDRRALLEDIAYVMKYIDTSEGLSVTQNLAAFFGRSSWSEIVSASVIASYGVRRIYDFDVTLNKYENLAGEFAYFDFSSSNLIESWYAGVGCTTLKTDYREDSIKSLRADLALDETQGASEILYVYSYPENMIYTPYIRLRFHISDSAEDSLYEVKFIFGNEDGRAEGSVIVRGNEDNEALVDISQYVLKNMTESIRISVRSLSGENSECSLWVYDIYGLSKDYTSIQLDDLISLERDKIRKPEQQAEDRELFGKVAIALAIVIVTGAIGFGLFASFKREDKGAEASADNTSGE